MNTQNTMRLHISVLNYDTFKFIDNIKHSTDGKLNQKNNIKK